MLLLTAMKRSLSGGQEQGILIGTPWALGIPSQSPVPVGFTPALTPNSGTRAGSTPRLESLKGPADTDMRAAEKATAVEMNFMTDDESNYLGAIRMKECESATVELTTNRKKLRRLVQ